HAQSSARSARNRRGSLRQRLAHHHQPGSRGPLARSDRHPNARRRHPRPRHPQRLSHRAGRRELAQAAFNTVKSARARWRAHRTLGATRRWTTTGYATAQWKARSARRCPPPPGPTLTNRNFFSFCGGPNPSPLDQSGQAKHHHFGPRKQTPGGRHQIGTPAGFKSESVAGFLLECVAGFVGIRNAAKVKANQWLIENVLAAWRTPFDPRKPETFPRIVAPYQKYITAGNALASRARWKLAGRWTARPGEPDAGTREIFVHSVGNKRELIPDESCWPDYVSVPGREARRCNGLIRTIPALNND